MPHPASDLRHAHREMPVLADEAWAAGYRGEVWTPPAGLDARQVRLLRLAHARGQQDARDLQAIRAAKMARGEQRRTLAEIAADGSIMQRRRGRSDREAS